MNRLFKKKNQPPSLAVVKLKEFLKSPEDPWTKKSFTLLCSKITREDQLENLVAALSVGEMERSGNGNECCIIPITKDGRLQVSHSKCRAEHVSCRLWRWPNMKANCKITCICGNNKLTNAKQKYVHVCINPYHYKIVLETEKPPVVHVPVPKQVKMDSDGQLCARFNGLRITKPSYSSSDSNPPSCSTAEKLEAWATIRYYEHRTRVGDAFKCRKDVVMIDGYTHPPTSTSDRFSLGSLTNINRETSSERVRQQIGEGLYLIHKGRTIHVLNQSKSHSIFVNSKYLNYTNEKAAGAVEKVPPGATLTVFDFPNYIQLLDTKKRENNGYESIETDLKSMPTLMFSFIKGWGDGYRRTEVLGCPCWMEVDLHAAFMELDKVLLDEGPPKPETISS